MDTTTNNNELAGLEAAARAADAGGATVAPGADLGTLPSAPVPDPRAQIAAEVSGLVAALVTVFSPFLPSLKGIYTDATIKAVGDAVAPVCVKHGWSLSGKYAEELGALAVLGPLAFATYGAVRHDLEAAKAAKAKPVNDAPGQGTSAEAKP